MFIKRYNYQSQFVDIDSLANRIKRVLLEGSYILTKDVEEFERSFGNYVGTQFCKGTNSGTDAIYLALCAVGISEGDEVITQANTFHATVAAILLARAKPVLVDVDLDTFDMNVAQVKEAIGPRTKVILPVHLYGKPGPIREVCELAEKHGIFVIEDAAQAHGAKVAGKHVGAYGTIGCFSFHPSKNLAAAGDGGAVVTSSPHISESVARLRSLGQRAQNEHVCVGVNSKLDSIQALVLLAKLPLLEAWNSCRRQVAGQYKDTLASTPLEFQRTLPDEEHVYHLLAARTERRDDLLAFLRSKGVDAIVRYPQAIHQQPAFERFSWKHGQYPNAEILANQLLCLPIRPDMACAEVDYVCSCVRMFYDASAI